MKYSRFGLGTRILVFYFLMLKENGWKLYCLTILRYCPIPGFLIIYMTRLKVLLSGLIIQPQVQSNLLCWWRSVPLK